MCTLIAHYDSSGCIRRCDANCYNATGPRCTCICGGRNHGVGYAKAIENNTDQFRKAIQTQLAANPETASHTLEFLGQRYRADQPTLF